MSQEKITVSIDADLEELIPGFLENRLKDIDNLKSAAGADDFERLRSIGHSLKGVGGGYGFDTITLLGAEIESSAKARDMDRIKQSIAELAGYLQRVEIKFE